MKKKILIHICQHKLPRVTQKQARPYDLENMQSISGAASQMHELNCTSDELSQMQQHKGMPSSSDKSSEMQDLKSMHSSSDESSQMQVCACTSVSSYVSYDSGGCLPCVRQDCSYHIQNFVETILDQYHRTY